MLNNPPYKKSETSDTTITLIGKNVFFDSYMSTSVNKTNPCVKITFLSPVLKSLNRNNLLDTEVNLKNK